MTDYVNIYDAGARLLSLLLSVHFGTDGFFLFEFRSLVVVLHRGAPWNARRVSSADKYIQRQLPRCETKVQTVAVIDDKQKKQHGHPC